MDDIRKYLLTIIAASIISAIAVSITDKKGAISSIVKLLTGIFLSITVISPLVDLPLLDMTAYFSDIKSDAGDIIADGQQLAAMESETIIKSQTEAYILSKASSLGVSIEVEVVLTDTEPKVPESVIIKGSAAPYIKKHLQQIITNDIGIQEEDQSWI